MKFPTLMLNQSDFNNKEWTISKAISKNSNINTNYSFKNKFKIKRLRKQQMKVHKKLIKIKS